jgi:hypothetical protein
MAVKLGFGRVLGYRSQWNEASAGHGMGAVAGREARHNGGTPQ